MWTELDIKKDEELNEFLIDYNQVGCTAHKQQWDINLLKSYMTTWKDFKILKFSDDNYNIFFSYCYDVNREMYQIIRVVFTWKTKPQYIINILCEFLYDHFDGVPAYLKTLPDEMVNPLTQHFQVWNPNVDKIFNSYNITIIWKEFEVEFYRT